MDDVPAHVPAFDSARHQPALSVNSRAFVAKCRRCRLVESPRRSQIEMASRYESVRRQLDTLLGADRDQPLSTKSSGPPQPPGIVDIEAPDICKDYLLGLCLSSLSIKRRGGLLVCTKVHSEEARSRFRDLLAQGRPPRDYVRWQHELIDNCRAIVSEEDRRISGAARRLKESYGFTEPPSAIIVQDLGVLQELGILLNGVLSADAQVRNVDEEEDADGLDQDMDRSAALRQEKSEPDLAIKIIGVDGGAKNEETTPVKREKTENALDVSKEEREVKTSTLKEESGAPENAPTLPSKKKEPPLSEAQELARSKLRDSTGVGPGGLLLNRDYKQRVCGQCGGLISLHDAETRLASHYAGKQHTSLVSLRDKLREVSFLFLRRNSYLWAPSFRVNTGLTIGLFSCPFSLCLCMHCDLLNTIC